MNVVEAERLQVCLFTLQPGQESERRNTVQNAYRMKDETHYTASDIVGFVCLKNA